MTIAGLSQSTAVTKPPVTPSTLAEDAVMLLLATATMLGALTDAWAHTNILTELEGFFTPWHALFYTGVLACTAWTVWLAYRRRHGHPRWWLTAWPAGYRIGALGAVLLGVGGAGDMLWHEIFGVEADLQAVLSPTHFLVDAGLVLLLTSPLRSWFAEGVGVSRIRAVTGAGSLALGAVSAAFFFAYVSAFTTLAPVQPYIRTEPGSQASTTAGVSTYLVTTVLLLVPVLLVYRRRIVPGAGTAVAGVIALFMVAMHEFPPIQSIAAITATVGAFAAEFALYRLDTRRGPDARLRLPIAGALFIAILWAAQLLGLHLAAGIAWPAELYSGIVVLTALIGAAIGGLAARPATVSR